MAKALGRKGSRRIVHPPQPPKLKLFRPVSWYGGIMVEPTGEYVSHVMKELGRLGLEIHDIERRERPPNTKTVPI
jgi:hypothetical protein